MTSLPSRADHVGSLLRPQHLLDARDEHDHGSISDAELRSIEDDCISEIVTRQEQIGLEAITDGEFRREYWHLDFLGSLDGIDLVQRDRPAGFRGDDTNPPMPGIVDSIGHGRPVFVDAFEYLTSQTTKTAKTTIPGPGMAHILGGRAAISADVYPELDGFWNDLVAAYREEVAQLYAAGCRYLQIDDVSFAYLCDPDFRDKVRARGDDPDDLLAQYRDATNAIIADRPADLLVTTHMCRGNFRSRWVASGGYEPAGEPIFARLDVDAFFLEFDSHRAGGFEPLRWVPEGKVAVVGLVTTKTAELESQEALVARLHEAMRVLPAEQLAISPQCGFSSTHHGNELSEADQWAKLDLCVRLAEQFWG